MLAYSPFMVLITIKTRLTNKKSFTLPVPVALENHWEGQHVLVPEMNRTGCSAFPSHLTRALHYGGQTNRGSRCSGPTTHRGRTYKRHCSIFFLFCFFLCVFLKYVYCIQRGRGVGGERQTSMMRENH